MTRGSELQMPAIEGPVTSGSGRVVLVSTSLDLGAVGYVQEEYFVHGAARAFTSSSPLAADGRWNVAPLEGDLGLAEYSTRIVVHRPLDANEFSGTVVIEWLNVSAGYDTAPDWLAAHNALIRDRVTWIGVSAQAAGVHGGGAAVGGVAAGGLRAADPERYESLQHPGDSYSYDIFSQVGRAARAELLPFPAGAVQTVIAIGESQSAFRMVTYVNGMQVLEQVFDGFLVHSRGGSGAPLAQDPLPEVTVATGTIVRTDLDVPVLVLQTETDLTVLGSVHARQPDSDRIRFWEVAGTAHADAYTAELGFNDTGDGRAESRLLDMSRINGGPLGCANPINTGPGYAVLQAGLHGLIQWCAGGDPLPGGPFLELQSSPDEPVVIARDERGNARGGIRTPMVDAPIAALRGDGNDGQDFCRLFGTTVPFDDEQLAALYPHADDYVAAFERSTTAAESARFLLAEEAQTLRRAATEVAARLAPD